MWILRKEVIASLFFYLLLAFVTLRAVDTEQAVHAQNPLIFALIIPAAVLMGVIMQRNQWYLALVPVVLAALLPDVIEALFIPFLLIAISLYVYSGRSAKELAADTGLRENPGARKAVFGSLLWFLILMASIALSALILMAFGINDRAAVLEKVQSFSIPLIITGVTIAPVAEELFFRGVLLNKAGIIPSSLLFAVAHVSYGSIGEIVSAFIAGVVLCKARQSEKTLVIPIIVHIMINAISMSVMFYYG